MKTVYMMGAGASAAEGAPVVGNFLRTAYAFFKREQYYRELDIVWEFLEYFYGRKTRIDSEDCLDNYPGIDELFNIVDWYLLHDQAFSVRFPLARLHDLKTALVKLISMTLDRSLPPVDGIHHGFVARVLNAGRNASTFISLNYDIILDRAIRAGGYGVEYGFYGNHGEHLQSPDRVPLYKLHGSLNWSFCPLCGEISEHNERVAHLLIEEGNSITCLNCGMGNSRAVIIAPTLYKSYKISRLHNVWDSAGLAVSRCDRLVIVGYSLAPSDTSIIAMLKRALNAPDKNREIIVINPNEKACLRYRQIFGECKIVCAGFTGQTPWLD